MKRDAILFANLVGVGELFIECCFFAFEGRPILFTCVNDKGERYFGLCSEFRDDLRWVLTEISDDTLLRVLQKKLDLVGVFTANEKVFSIRKDRTVGIMVQSMFAQDMDPLELPEPGTLLECDEEARMYIQGKLSLQRLETEAQGFVSDQILPRKSGKTEASMGR